ncbi:MAG: hypothetical protein IPM29_16680 [Planctomycetes bacterium]|nr:hypothetical protein [Planctomycetota bacterium]
MSSAVRDLLARLASAVGLHEAPAPGRASPADGVDLSRAAPLLDLASPPCAARIEERIARPPIRATTEAAVAARLRAACGLDADAEVRLARSPGVLRDAFLAAARAARGAPDVLCVHGAPPGDGADLQAIPPERGMEALAALTADPARFAALLVEPRPLGAGDTLAALCAAAVHHGLPVLLDETATAFRLAPGAAGAAQGLPADAFLLGPSLAGGLPFAALCGRDLPPVDDAPDAATLLVADASLDLLAERPVADSAAAAGAELRERLVRRLAAEDVRAELLGPDAMPRIRFAGQENAEAPLIAHHFQLELRAAGVLTDGPDLLPPPRKQIEPVARAFEHATSRIRTLLIEHNSYLSGGLPWPFAGDVDPRLRERGLARYRYPKLAAVDVDSLPDERGVRIAFAAGELGPITSSGFYLPTRLRGDLDIRVTFRVERWEPGPDSACLGLFLQNEASTARYYAQLMSTADRKGEHSVAAGLEGRLLGRRTVDGSHGQLRLTRVGRQVCAWYAPADSDAWVELGALTLGCDDDVICGAKIWSKVRCGGLVVLLHDLQVTATLPAEQLPRLEPRPDPRRSG